MTIQQLPALIRRAFRRAAGLFEKPTPTSGVHAVTIDGIVFYLDHGQHTHRRIAVRKGFEPELTAALAQSVRAGEVVADIGSNFGWHSLQLAHRVPDLTLYAFEPGAQAHGLFTRNLGANALPSGRIELERLAIGAEVGEVTLRQFGGLGTVNASIYPLGDLEYQGEDVPVKPLDAVVAEMAAVPTVIKCDVEGAERDVLEGCPRLLAGELGVPPLWFLEANYETSGMAGYFPWQLVEEASAHSPYRGYALRGGKAEALKSRTSLRHGETLILAIEDVHGDRLPR